MQTGLCLLGIALGVAVMVAIDGANRGALASFRDSVDLVAGRATHQVVADGGPDLPDEAFLVARNLPGVAAAAPVVEQIVRIRQAGGESLRLLGTDLFSEAPFRAVGSFQNGSRDGGEGQGSDGSLDLGAFLAEPVRVLIPEMFARRHGLTAGSLLTLISGAEDTTATVQGVFRPAQLERGADSLAFMDIAGAQELLGKVGRIDRIDLIVEDSSEEAMDRMRSQLPAGMRLIRPDTRTERVERMIASFQMNLYALSMLAVFVGIFLIHNTLTFAVIQRRRQIGILRCVGLSRGAVARSFLLEALFLGTVGSLLGLILGAVLARYTVGAVGRTITEAFAQPIDPGLVMDGWTALKAFTVGLTVSLGAALLPAMEAARVQPTAAVARPEADRRVLALAPMLALGGVGSLLVSYLLVLLPVKSALPGHLGAFFILLGFGLMIPLASVMLARWAAPALGRWLGLPVDLGIRSITASLSRTAPAMVALLVALAMVVGVTLMVQSFRKSLVDWIGQTIRADVYIVPEGRSGRGNEAFLPDGLLQRLSADPAVAAVDTLRRIDTDIRGIPANINAFRFDLQLPRRLTVTPVLTGDSAEANRLCRETDAVLISDVLANLASLQYGDSLNLATPLGPREFRIAGIYRDYSADGGQVLMDLERFRRVWGDQRTNNCALYLRSGQDGDQVTDRLRAELAAAGYSLILRSHGSLRQEVIRVFDNTFAITFVMQGLTAAVAFCGILSALLALLLERTRELGTLRALGMTRPQIHSMLRSEAAGMGVLATVLGSAAGLLLSVLLVLVINVRSFGWTIELYITPGVFVAAAIIAILASLGATLWPARRLDAMPLASALREE